MGRDTEKIMKKSTENVIGGPMPRLVRRLPTAQQEVIDRLTRGEYLMWHPMGPEISGRPFWPQKRTVLAMLRDGLLVWGDYHNETQKQCGMRPLKLPPNSVIRSPCGNDIRQRATLEKLPEVFELTRF